MRHTFRGLPLTLMQETEATGQDGKSCLRQKTGRGTGDKGAASEHSGCCDSTRAYLSGRERSRRSLADRGSDTGRGRKAAAGQEEQEEEAGGKRSGAGSRRRSEGPATVADVRSSKRDRHLASNMAAPAAALTPSPMRQSSSSQSLSAKFPVGKFRKFAGNFPK